MNQEINKMLSAYALGTHISAIHALKEIIQALTLHTLSKTDFFSHAAFYGDTALRIFHGLGRFSGDMDFSLKTKDENFNLETYLPAIEQGLNSYGLEMSVLSKKKQHSSNVQSAFLKANTVIHLVKITAMTPPLSGIPNNALIKIKIEVDTNPPGGAEYERKFQLLPQPYSVLVYDRPSLFAGKLHALLCRNWKQREKGRDFYDYVWYLTEGVPVNIHHLEQRMRQSGHWYMEVPLTLEVVKEKLLNRFESLGFQAVKQDVTPFIPNPSVLDIWDKEFFSAITRDQLKGN